MDPTVNPATGKPCKGREAARALARVRQDARIVALVAILDSALLAAVDAALAPFAGRPDVMGGPDHGL